MALFLLRMYLDIMTRQGVSVSRSVMDKTHIVNGASTMLKGHRLGLYRVLRFQATSEFL